MEERGEQTGYDPRFPSLLSSAYIHLGKRECSVYGLRPTLQCSLETDNRIISLHMIA